MAMRRPRIKATANLMNVKRKKTLEQTDEIKPPTGQVADATCSGSSTKATHFVEQVHESSEKGENEELPIEDNNSAALEEKGNGVIAEDDNSTPLRAEEVVNGLLPTEPQSTLPLEDVVDKSAANLPFPEDNHENDAGHDSALFREDAPDGSFKCPQKVDVSNGDLETNVIQMDLQKSTHDFPLSPSKAQSTRQRIRPTPIFGQRRNSFVGSSPSPHTEENSSDFTAPSPRRERHYSGSQGGQLPNSATATGAQSSSSVHPHHTHHKYAPTMHVGRVRTESGCSAYSDTHTIAAVKRRPNDSNAAAEHGHRTSSSARRDFDARFNKGILEKSSLKMFDLIYYNPTTNPMEVKPHCTAATTIKKETTTLKTEPETGAGPADDEDKKSAAAAAAALPVPQLKLNANGELILDDKSLEIETTAEQEARKVLANSSLIVLDENTGMNGFYKRQKRTKDWPPEETVKFYRCLQIIGTDFSLMSQLFPKRTRRDLKLKFKKEERCNGGLINKALLYPKKFNVEELQQQLDKEEQEREETERQWKEMRSKVVKGYKKVDSKTSSGARALANGDDIYRNENVPKHKFSKRACAAAASERAEAIDAPSKPTNAPPGEVRVKQKRLKPKPKLAVEDKKEIVPILPLAEALVANADADAVAVVASDTFKVEVLHTVEVTAPEAEEEEVPQRPQPVKLIDARALEQELSGLLRSSCGGSHSMDKTSILPDGAPIMPPPGQEEDAPPPAADYDNVNHTFVNMDDGTVSFLNVEDISRYNAAAHANTGDGMVIVGNDGDDAAEAYAPHAPASPVQEHNVDAANDASGGGASQMDESDIQQILTELAEGSLVLVSTLDEDNADKVINEIYMVDNRTGEMYDEPLDIPEAIVQGIISVMS